MKKFVVSFLCSVCFLFNVSADWQKSWVEGIKHYEKSEFSQAEECLDVAIQELETNPDHGQSFVYVDRAKIRFSRDKYAEAMLDVTKALSFKDISAIDRMDAIRIRSGCHLFLGNIEQGVKDCKYFLENNTHWPQVEYTEDSIIIRNAPQDPKFKEYLEEFSIKIGDCETKEDIKQINSSTFIIKKKTNINVCEQMSEFIDKCGCGCSDEKKNSINIENLIEMHSISDCMWTCGLSATYAGILCGKIPSFLCQGACAAFVNELRLSCECCCNTGTFYKTCVALFANMAEKLANKLPQCPPPIEYN